MNNLKSLPKIELHAHLNGCLSNETLKELRLLKYGKEPENTNEDFYKIVSGHSITLQECFRKFHYAHDLTGTEEALKIATKNVIKEFSEDNVVYLELRTTPRNNQNLTKLQYLTSVLTTIRECEKLFPSTIVKLLPSIDRSKGVKEALENINIVQMLLVDYGDIIKGIDMSGNPISTNFNDFMEVLIKAKRLGLKLALHCGEMETDHKEIKDMFKFGLDRIGHGTFIEAENLEELKERKIPVECCISSNVKCGTVRTYEEHQFIKFYQMGIPVCICTDDYGVFETSLTKEYAICKETFKLDDEKMLEISEACIDYTFASVEEKARLRDIFAEFREKNNSNV